MNVLVRGRLVWLVNRISSASVAGGRKRIFRRAFFQVVVLTVGLALGSIAPTTIRVARASADDKKIVAALDTQYQAAVKENDAATMDHLLADDFVLVTGSGKIYTKADLLDEARSEQIHYEHQEDTDQTVRIWGDTAVITAKLWEKGTNQGKSFDRVVQRHLCAHSHWLAIRVRSVVFAPTRYALSAEATISDPGNVTKQL